MHIGIVWQDEVDRLIALHGANAIGTLVQRISDAVEMCDDQAVLDLDRILQLVEARIEGPWRIAGKRVTQ